MLYDIANAKQRIALLEARGYKLLGNFSERFMTWTTLGLGSFLFIKGESYRDYKYYEFKAMNLFSKSDFELMLDEEAEPVGHSFFYQITNEEYIYVIYIADGADEYSERLLILRSDPSKSGHRQLIGASRADANANANAKDIIVGGEIYYNNKKITLINRKSGSFRTEYHEAIGVISTFFGTEIEEAYHDEVENGSIVRESVNARIDRTQSSTHSSCFFSGSAASSCSNAHEQTAPANSSGFQP